MKVLDIYPNYCWFFEGNDFATISKMRAAAALPSDEERASAFQSMGCEESWRLLGDAVTFDFPENFADEITVNYTPTVLKRVQLHQRIRHWLKKPGTAHFASGKPAVIAEEPYIPLVNRIFRLGLKRLAPARVVS